MHSVINDLKYAARTFAKNPGFSAIAVITLALGIGANTAIFSVVEAVLLRPLPYPDPDRLALVWGELTSRNINHFPASPPDLMVYREMSQFEDVAGVFTVGLPLTGEGEPERVPAGIVTDNFFDVLGVKPLLGRGFEPRDAVFFDQNANPDVAPPPNAVLLSHGLWQRRFGRDPDIAGKSIRLGGQAATVVGVMPAGFRLLMPPQANLDANVGLWVAGRFDFENAPRGNVFLRVIVRLAPGVSISQAQAELDGIAGRLRDQFPIYATSGFRARAAPLHGELTQHVRPVVLALLGAVGFVLLIACANVANLLFVRATARAQEISVRAALGGSRARIVRQMLAESLLLSCVGGALGLLLAQGRISLLLTLQPGDLPRIDTVWIDGTVLAFTVGASILAALLFGTLPALHASKSNLIDALRGRTHTSSIGWQNHVRSGMGIVEGALSLVLLIGAGLMVRSFVELQHVEPGFDPEDVLTFQITVPQAQYPEAAERATFEAQLKRRVAALPGVEAAGGVFPLPLSGQAFNGRYGTEAALQDESNYRQAEYRAVVPGYFEAMGTRILSGRVFTEADYADSLPSVVVDELLARRLWPAEPAVGRRVLVRPLGPEPLWVDVIGVVEHQRHASLSEEGRETIYFSSRFLGSFGLLTWTIRTSVDPASLVNPIRREIAAIDPTIPISEVATMDTYVGAAMAQTRFTLTLIGAFAIAAMVLAAVGLYGVMAYAVRQRTGEIGVRMAFGAEPATILRLIVTQGMALALAGVAAGIAAAVGLTRVMTSMLVGVAPTDPLTFLGITALFLGVAALACYVPARRATRVEPVVALRSE